MIEEQFRGYSIQIGKNENENDELIDKSSPEDYWLHLSSVPSPHCVILNPNKKKIHIKIIRHAAYLTKKYSKYSHMSKVEVDVSKIKFLTKTNKKGLVVVTNVKTVNV